MLPAALRAPLQRLFPGTGQSFGLPLTPGAVGVPLGTLLLAVFPSDPLHACMEGIFLHISGRTFLRGKHLAA